MDLDEINNKNDVKIYMESELGKICRELLRNGIIYEGQFEVLKSMFCKQYNIEILEILSEETNLEIFYTYEKCYFIYYDTKRYSAVEARNTIRNFCELW